MATKKSAKAVTSESGTLNPADYQTNAFVHEVDLVPLIKKINAGGGGGGGGGGTSDYSDLVNKPSIESTTLQGNLSASQLGLATVTQIGSVNQNLSSLSNRVLTTETDISTLKSNLSSTDQHLTSTDNRVYATEQNVTILANGLAEKQEKLTAGDNITIENNIISATIPSTNPSLIGAYSIYDETERIIGYYMGKPLYRKIINDTLPNVTDQSTSVTKNIDVSSLHTEEFVTLKGVGKYTNGSMIAFNPILLVVSSDNTNNAIRMNFRADLNVITITSNNASMSNMPIVIIFEYTKTTDTASTIAYGHENEYTNTPTIVGTFNTGTFIIPVYQQTFGPIRISETPDETGRRLNIIVGEIPSGKLILYISGIDTNSTRQRVFPVADTYIGEHQYIIYNYSNGRLIYNDYNISGTPYIIFTVKWCDDFEA